eukprot:1563862-Rhodomonas_salina.1
MTPVRASKAAQTLSKVTARIKSSANVIKSNGTVTAVDRERNGGGQRLDLGGGDHVGALADVAAHHLCSAHVLLSQYKTVPHIA